MDALELCRARRGEPIRAVQLDSLFVLDERAVKLILLLELARAEDVVARGVLRRPLELDLVFRVVGTRLQGVGVVLHRRVPVAGARGVPAFSERTPGRAPRYERGDDEQCDKPSFH